MKGIENIYNRIIKDAQDNASAIINEATGTANEIAAEANVKVTKILNEARVLNAQKANEAENSAALSAGMKIKKMFLNEKRVLVEEVFSKALSVLLNLPQDEYITLLVKLAKRAVSDGTGGEIILNEKDRAKIGDTVLAEVNKAISGVALTLAEDTAPIVGGLVIRRGLIEINCALDVVLRLLSEEETHSVSDILFGKGV